MNCFPTLVIGIGPTGEFALRRIKSLLLDFGAGQLPQKVKLLWIGDRYTNIDAVGLATLDPIEKVEIKTDFEKIPYILNSNPQNQVNFSWWHKSTDNHCSVDGRMAYFWETQFQNRNRLSEQYKNCLERLLLPPDTSFRVFLVASPAEYEAGMLFDLALDLSERFLFGKIRELVPWLLLKPYSSPAQGYSPELLDSGAMRYAFFREMHRFMRGGTQVLDHGNRGLEVYDRILFDRVFVYDHPLAPAIVPSQIVGLIERTSANKLNEIIRSTLEINANALSISTINSLEYVFPIGDIQRYCTAAFAVDTLYYGELSNVKPYGLIPLQSGHGSMDFLLPVLDFREEVSRFLSDDLADRQMVLPAYPFIQINFAAKHQWPNRLGALPGDLVSSFHDRLCVFMNRAMLNLISTRNREGSLAWAERFLSQLRIVLDDAESTVHSNASQNPLGKILYQNYEELKKIVRQYHAQVSDWKNVFLYPVLSKLQNQKAHAEADLDESLKENPTRKVILPNSEGTVTDLGNFYYEREVIVSPQGRDAISQARANFHWEWTQDVHRMGVLNLVLGAPSAEGQTEERLVLNSSRVSAQPALFCDWWIELSTQLTRFLYETISMTETVAKQRVNQTDLYELLGHRPEPEKKQTSHFLIIGNDLGGSLTQWAKMNALDIAGEALVSSEYMHRVLLMQLNHSIGVDSIQSLQDDREKNRYSPQYIFPHEQKVAEIEGNIRGQKQEYFPTSSRKKNMTLTPEDLTEASFSVPFIRLMIDPDIFETTMELVFMDLIKPKMDDFGRSIWGIESMDGLKRVDLNESFDPAENDLMNAIRTILICYPSNQSVPNNHPLFAFNSGNRRETNYYKTMEGLKRMVDIKFRDGKKLLKNEAAGIVQRINEWKLRGDQSYSDLALFQTHLYLKVKN